MLVLVQTLTPMPAYDFLSVAYESGKVDTTPGGPGSACVPKRARALYTLRTSNE